MKHIFKILLVIMLGISLISCTSGNDNGKDEKVENIISLIDKLPEEVTLEIEDELIQIEGFYAELNSTQKNKVTNYDIYLSKVEQLNQLKIQLEKQQTIEDIINQINELPSLDDVTLEHLVLVTNIKNSYDALDDESKNQISNYNVLTDLMSKLTGLQQVEAVETLIEQLPIKADVTINDKEKIAAARSSYNELSDELKALVENYTKLDDAEKAISSIEKSMSDAQVVIDLINQLPTVDELTYDHKKQVETARNKYTSLTSRAKPYVTNLDKLELLEDKMKELKVIENYKANAKKVVDLISALPSKLTIDDRSTLDNCVLSYDNLLDVEKVYVTNYNTLLAKIEEMEEIIANTSYDVVVVLNGGYLDNMKEDTELNEKFSFTVNNYSSNIWSAYSNNIFIYKTSLMNAADQYTSFLKIGFSIDTKTNKYLIKQIVKSGTALSSDLKTSDYYILVHSDYASGYSTVNNIEIGQYLSSDVSLPSAATSSLNAKISILTFQDTGNYRISFKGYNTLPVPQRAGYVFLGWYLDSSFTSKVITEVSSSVTLYAKWTADKGEITTDTILNCVSDVVASNTEDILLLENDEATFKWSSSNSNLYQIKGDKGIVSKVYQTHKKQQVTISVEISYKTGGKKTVSKQITVNPILFEKMSANPIATYFYTGAISGYKKYNDRYVAEKTLFSETTKETLDIIYYAFIVPSSNGTVSFQDTSYLDEVRQLRNHNVRIIGCVNGVGSGTSQAFKTITASPTLRATFINNLMNLVEEYNLDGLDLDWEAVSETLKPVASQYNLLCQELRAEMDKRQDVGGTPYLLTMAVPASSYGTATDRFDFKTLNNYLDYINIMSYDLNNSNLTTHLSPLYSSTNDNGYGFGAVYGVNRISSLGFDKNKLIIGCAGYGKAYKVGGTNKKYPALGVSGTLTKISGYDGSFASGTVYGSVINQLINSGNYVEYTEKDSSGRIVGSYLYSESQNIFVTYDSKTAVMAKYEYAKANGLGMMCWAYTEDTSDTVINAIYEAKNK